MGQFTPIASLPRTVGDPRSDAYWDSSVRPYPRRRRPGIAIDYEPPGPTLTIHQRLEGRYRELLNRPRYETAPADTAEAALLQKLLTQVPPGHELKNLAKWEQRFQGASSEGVRSLTDASGESWDVTPGVLEAFRRIQLVLQSASPSLKPPPRQPPTNGTSRPPTHPRPTAASLCPIHRVFLAYGSCPECTRGRNHAGNRHGGSG